MVLPYRLRHMVDVWDSSMFKVWKIGKCVMFGNISKDAKNAIKIWLCSYDNMLHELKFLSLYLTNSNVVKVYFNPDWEVMLT